MAADKLYPEGYDFSIVFDAAEQRKLRHAMERKYVEDILEYPDNKIWGKKKNMEIEKH